MENSALNLQDSNIKKYSIFNTKDALLTFFVVALFVLELAGGFYGWSRMSKITSESDDLRSQASTLRTENDTLKQNIQSLNQQKDDLQKKLDALIATDPNNSLRLKGIDPSIQDIRVLALGVNWRDDNYSYEIKNAYVTPVIADYSFVKSNPNFKDKFFLMFEIIVTDNRPVGDSQVVPVNSLITLKSADVILSPFSQDYLYLNPHEKKTMFAGFAVNSDSSVFTLLAGSSDKPQYIDVNFSKSTTTLKGVFMLKTGYAPQYAEY